MRAIVYYRIESDVLQIAFPEILAVGIAGEYLYVFGKFEFAA